MYTIQINKGKLNVKYVLLENETFYATSENMEMHVLPNLLWILASIVYNNFYDSHQCHGFNNVNLKQIDQVIIQVFSKVNDAHECVMSMFFSFIKRAGDVQNV